MRKRRDEKVLNRAAGATFLQSASILLALAVIGCGHSGDDDNDSPSPTASPSPSPSVTPTPEVTPLRPQDEDEDGYALCVEVGETSACDCDDQNGLIHPNAEEVCNAQDDNCDGLEDNRFLVDQKYVDLGPDLASLLLMVPDGSKIEVACSGHYQGPFLLERSAITLECTALEEPCVLEGEGVDSVVRIAGATEGSSAMGTTIVRGFSLAGGYASRGGGVDVYNTDVLLDELVIQDNVADIGGGISAFSADPEAPIDVYITRSQLSNNQATMGGGLYFENANVTLNSVVLMANSAPTGYGGGMSLASGAFVDASHVLFYSNEATWGGGFHLEDASLGLAYALIEGNIGTLGGGGRVGNVSVLTLEHSVLVDNAAIGDGGGLRIDGSSSELELSHSILAFNFSSGSGSNASVFTAKVRSSFSCFYVEQGDGEQGDGLSGMSLSETDMSLEPLFRGAEAGTLTPRDCHLSEDSGLVNVGDPGSASRDPDGSRVDIGAFGGAGADDWDLNGNALEQYYWPGSLEDKPSDGFESFESDLHFP